MRSISFPQPREVSIDKCLDMISACNTTAEVCRDVVRDSCPATNSLSITLYVKDVDRMKAQMSLLINALRKVEEVEAKPDFSLEESYAARAAVRRLVTTAAILCAKLDQLMPTPVKQQMPVL